MKKIQKKLKVDYLYVVWINWMQAATDGYGKTTYSVWPDGNMIQYPKGKVVAATKIVRAESDSPLALFRPKDYYIVKVIEKSAKDMVAGLVKATGGTTLEKK